MSLQSKLIEYGLTEKEARIYLSSMELGPSPVQKIAKHADINRVTAYAVIDILMEKGLMSTFEDGKRTVYVASEPESLMNLFDQQKRSIDDHEKDLQKTLPEFRSKYNLAEGKPIVRYYEGLDGVISMNDDTLQVDSDKIFTSYNIDVVNNFFSSEFLERLKERRIKKGINISIIYRSDKVTLPERKNAELYKIEDEGLQLPADLMIIGDKARFISFGDKVSGIVIEDRQIAETLKTIFNLAIKGLKEK